MLTLTKNYAVKTGQPRLLLNLVISEKNYAVNPDSYRDGQPQNNGLLIMNNEQLNLQIYKNYVGL